MSLKPATTKILDLIEPRLASIKTSYGYPFTVQKIERGRMIPWNPGDMPACNYWLTGVQNDRGTPYRQDKRTLPLYVELHMQTRDDNFQDTADLLAACIVIAINREPKTNVSSSESRHLGGAVKILNLAGYDYELSPAGQSPWVGALCRFELVYTTAINDMENFEA